MTASDELRMGAFSRAGSGQHREVLAPHCFLPAMDEDAVESAQPERSEGSITATVHSIGERGERGFGSWNPVWYIGSE